jgi:Flp pilus assembly protein TadG
MRRMHGILAPARKDEEGAVALMVAVSLVALLVAVAMVLDFGQARLDRQVNKAAADSAVAAGMRGLDGGTGDVYSWRGVCEALRYLQASAPSLSAIALPPSCTDGSQDTVVCDKDNTATHARFEQVIATSDGEVTVQVQIPYTADDMAAFPEESLSTLADDQGEDELEGCDQIGVVIWQGRAPSMGQLLNEGEDITSAVRSVGRVRVNIDGDVAVALLILEQTDCQALAITSGGAGGRIRVKGFEDKPGIIHVDSAGTGSGCNKPILVGKNPGTCPGPDSCGGIVADEAEQGDLAGQISTSALANMSDGRPMVHSGPYPPGADPIFRPQMTRELVDLRYLEPVRNAVATDAGPAFAAAAAGTPPLGYTEVGCDPATPINHAKVFVKCGNFNKANKKFTGTHIIFTGQVSATSLELPNAERVYIVGGTSPAGLSVSSLRLHDHGSAAQCQSPAPGEHRARLFIRTGQMTVAGSGSLKLCNTTVILMGGQSTACLPGTPGTAPSSTPCGGSTGNGTLNFGGGASIDWTGPNTTPIDQEATTADWADLEDLGAWSETAGEHSVGGGGFMHMSGVFMVPNANPFKINGGGAQDVENSQYIVRKLWNTGNGQLTMRPNPRDVVTFPILEGFELVR